jgi:phosphoheptose isomerase
MTVDLTSLAPMEAPARVRFPDHRFATAADFCARYFDEAMRAASSIDLLEVERAAQVLLQAYTGGAAVFACGNGGSAAIANHLGCDHLKGVRTLTDLRPRITSLSANVEVLTAIGNDIGFEDIFVYQLESMAQPGDVLVAVSSSGRSANIVRALRWAGDHGVSTIALTGFTGGDARDIADVAIHVECDNYGVVEDLHQATMHAMAQYIRQSRMAAETVGSTVF